MTEQAFIEQLHELHHKIDFAKEQSFKGALSVNDVGNDLEKLKVKVLYHRSAIHLPQVNSASLQCSSPRPIHYLFQTIHYDESFTPFLSASPIVCYRAVFSFVTQRSSPLVGRSVA